MLLGPSGCRGVLGKRVSNAELTEPSLFSAHLVLFALAHERARDGRVRPSLHNAR